MKIQLPANGKTTTNSNGERSRYDYTDEYVIHTYEDIDDGEKFLRRLIKVGTFAVEEGMWDLNSSRIEFEGSFEIVPNAKKTVYNEYPAPPTTLEKSNAEWGKYYKIATEANRPILDESIYEHKKNLIFQFSDFGEFDGTSFEEGAQPTADRSVITTNKLDKFIPKNWWQEPFSYSPKSESITDNEAIFSPTKFNKKSADKITSFNPETDTLEIDTDSFGIDSSATFASGKNKKAVNKKLAMQDFDFLYDQKKGGLYFNENGAEKSFGDGGIIAILKGAPDLTSTNLEFI